MDFNPEYKMLFGYEVVWRCFGSVFCEFGLIVKHIREEDRGIDQLFDVHVRVLQVFI